MTKSSICALRFHRTLRIFQKQTQPSRRFNKILLIAKPEGLTREICKIVIAFCKG